MKPIYWIIPAAALAGVAVWNVKTSSELKKVAAENHTLRSRLSPSGPRASTTNRRGEAKPATPAEWKNIAAKLTGETGDTEESLQEILTLQDRVAAMSDAELATALENMESMDLTQDERDSLEELLIDPLIEKNPQLALEKFADQIKTDEDGMGWKLSEALANWAKNDLAGATKWLDSQIASGTFEAKSLDGHNFLLLDYEAAVVSELLAQNPAEAERRIGALDEDLRREALERITFSDLGNAAQETYAKLIRSLVPADERSGSFVYIMDQLVPERGFEGVDAFFQQTHASEEEKSVASQQAANVNISEIASERSVTSADIDAMRTWLQKYSPNEVNKVTGEALAEATQDGGEFTFDQASALVKQYHQQSGDDQVIIGFLKSFAARSNLEEALPLAQLIANPARRQEILDELQ